MTKAFLNTYGLAQCLVFFVLWLNGYAWEPLGVIVIAVAIIAAGTPAEWPAKVKDYESIPASLAGATPGRKWWEETAPLDLPGDADRERGRHA